MNKLGKLILFLFELQNNIKLYHWQTTSYPRHIATDNLHTELSALIDQFVEVYMGRYTRPMYKKSRNIIIGAWTDKNAESKVKETVKYLSDLTEYLDNKKDTDLLNIRDEMLGVLNKTLYLFTLN